jgi:predicted small metal-binding protein
MAMKLVCKETGADCPFEVTASTREELMQHVGVHATMAHPEMAANPPSPEMIEKLIHVV